MDDVSFGLYIHIPYCRKKCAYCGFLSFSCGQEGVPDEYLSLLEREMRLYEERVGRLKADTVFFGGGTPSLLTERQSERLFAMMHEHVHADAEVTLEANPESLTKAKLQLYKSLGVTRLSIGIQSLEDDLLRAIGRVHDRKTALSAYEAARMAGHENINLDFLCGLPGQSPENFAGQLRELLSLAPEHLSLYTLQLEEGSPFYTAYKEYRLALPDETEERAMYRAAAGLLREAGYERYEISNWSRPGRRCRHNEKYWHMAPFVGLGLGASSYVLGRRYQNPSEYNAWKEGILRGGLTYDVAAPESVRDAMGIFCFTALRTTDGLNTTAFSARFGVSIEEAYREAPLPVEEWSRRGLLEVDGDTWRLTERGIDVSNTIMAEFLFDPA